MKFNLDEKSKDTLRRIKDVQYYESLGMSWAQAFEFVNKTLPSLKENLTKKPKLTLIKGGAQ